MRLKSRRIDGHGYTSTLSPEPPAGGNPPVRAHLVHCNHGTGILALALNQFPLAIPGLKELVQGLWFANRLVPVVLADVSRWPFFFDRSASSGTA